ncbi:MAG TPA: hypothetical protein VMW80_10450 [Candidatus Dormibacteraeota bacterium]|nr:hypothetical protein [Candidatus Dormibacteraeota bacterium]
MRRNPFTRLQLASQAAKTLSNIWNGDDRIEGAEEASVTGQQVRVVTARVV